MYCSNCGKKLSKDDFFCSNCGTPVLRQALFNENDNESNEDAFEETRLFTAEELGQFLNDETDEVAPNAEKRSQSPFQQDYQDYQQDYIEEPFLNSDAVENEQQVTNSKNIDAKGKVSDALGSASAAMGKLKSRRLEAKMKKAEKKQKSRENSVASVDAETPVENVSVNRTEGHVSLKKIVLPVIVLGLIIGLVFGLILVQPWNNPDEEADATTGAVMLVEIAEQQ